MKDIGNNCSTDLGESDKSSVISNLSFIKKRFYGIHGQPKDENNDPPNSETSKQEVSLEAFPPADKPTRWQRKIRKVFFAKDNDTNNLDESFKGRNEAIS